MQSHEALIANSETAVSVSKLVGVPVQEGAFRTTGSTRLKNPEFNLAFVEAAVPLVAVIERVRQTRLVSVDQPVKKLLNAGSMKQFSMSKLAYIGNRRERSL